MFKEGVRVKALVPVGIAPTEEQGVVIKIDKFHVCVEFDRYISGHDGGLEVRGKFGHCWWLEITSLQPLEANNNLEATFLLKEEF